MCHIDREGCFVTADVIYDSCYPDFCIVEFPADWAGSLNVVEAQFEYRDYRPYYRKFHFHTDSERAAPRVDIQRRLVICRRARDGGYWIHMAKNGPFLQHSEDMPHGICRVAGSMGQRCVDLHSGR